VLILKILIFKILVLNSINDIKKWFIKNIFIIKTTESLIIFHFFQKGKENWMSLSGARWWLIQLKRFKRGNKKTFALFER